MCTPLVVVVPKWCPSLNAQSLTLSLSLALSEKLACSLLHVHAEVNELHAQCYGKSSLPSYRAAESAAVAAAAAAATTAVDTLAFHYTLIVLAQPVHASHS